MVGTLRTFVLTVVLLPAAACTQSAAEAPLLDRWLAHAGADIENVALVTELKANRDLIEPQLIQAFRNGPTDADREALEESVEHVLSLVQQQLAEPMVYGLDEGDIAEMKALNLETEKRRALERFEYNFKAGALLGLGVTQGSEGKILLEQLASDSSSPFYLLAADALRYQ